MRKIEKEMLAAIDKRCDWTKDNTSVIFSDHNGNLYLDATVYLYDNEIAMVLPDGEIVPVVETFAKYPTNTTRSRLLALGIDASIKNSAPHIDGKPL